MHRAFNKKIKVGLRFRVMVWDISLYFIALKTIIYFTILQFLLLNWYNVVAMWPYYVILLVIKSNNIQLSLCLLSSF